MYVEIKYLHRKYARVRKDKYGARFDGILYRIQARDFLEEPLENRRTICSHIEESFVDEYSPKYDQFFHIVINNKMFCLYDAINEWVNDGYDIIFTEANLYECDKARNSATLIVFAQKSKQELQPVLYTETGYENLTIYYRNSKVDIPIAESD